MIDGKYFLQIIKDTPELSAIEQLRLFIDRHGPQRIVFDEHMQEGMLLDDEFHSRWYGNSNWLRKHFESYDEAFLKSVGISLP
jgi:hypothetical protein